MDEKKIAERLDELLEAYSNKFGPWPMNATMPDDEWIATLETCLRNNRPYREMSGEDPGMYE